MSWKCAWTLRWQVLLAALYGARGAGLNAIDLCSEDGRASMVYQSFEEVKFPSACRVLSLWDSVLTTFAPERLIVTEDAFQVESKWHLPWGQIMEWNYLTLLVREIVQWSGRGRQVQDDWSSQVQACALAAFMLYDFAIKISLLELTSAEWKAAQVAVDHTMGWLVNTDQPGDRADQDLSQTVTEYMQELLTSKVLLKGAVSMFGVLQWLSIAQKLALREYGTWQQPPCLHRPSNTTHWSGILANLASCLLQRASDGPKIKSLGWILLAGRQYWGPLHRAMAKDSGVTPYVLSLPNTLGDVPDPYDLPRVELCTTARHRHRLQEWSTEGGSRGPVPPWHGISAAQPDGATVTVTAAAAVASPSSGSRPHHFLVEFLVYAERPGGEQRGDQSIYICGPHAAILPEVPMRKWHCAFGETTSSDVFFSESLEATAVSVFRQAATIRCPVPDWLRWTDRPVLARLESTLDGTSSPWQIDVELCPKMDLHLDYGSNRSHSKGMRASHLATERSSLSLAVCSYPAWDLSDLERSVPGLVQTFISYYMRFGAFDIAIYDYDGTFGQHPEILKLLAAGKMRYFPFFAHGVSKLLGAFWHSGGLVGSTGSKTSFMQELSLNHCILNYRGVADLVLLSAMDSFLVVGSSVAAFPRRCFNRHAVAQACCSFPLNSSAKALCWEAGRTFSKCCVEMDQANFQPELNPWQRFLQSRSANFWNIWRILGAISLSVCEFSIPQGTPSRGRPLLLTHLWRPKECRGLPQHIVNPWRFLSQNAEWLKLQPGSARYCPETEDLRVAHLVNLHKVRCTERQNTYGYGRLPCRMVDFGLRWAIS